MVKNIFKNSQHLFERQENSILSAAFIITAAVFLSALLGLFRDRLMVSYFYHDKSIYDAYLVAFRLPDLVFQILVLGALSAAFIPVFSRYQHQDRQEATLVANSMINLILILFFVFSVLIFIFAGPLNNLFTGDNFSLDQLQLASNLTRIMLFAQIFFAFSNFMTGIIQAHQRFLVPALAPLVYNLGIIIGIVLLGPIIGIYGAAVGVVLGAFLHFVSQVPLAYKLGYRYSTKINFLHPGVKEISKLMLPRTLALSVNQIEMFTVTFFATSLPMAGSLAIITLADRLVSLPIRVFGTPIGQASLPFLSQVSAKKEMEQFKSTLLNSLHQILYLAFPATALLIILRIPLVRIAFGAKNFPWQDTLLTGKVVALFSLAIFAHASIQLLSRAFYALHNTKTPLIAALCSVTTNIVISIIFVFHFGYGVLGLALAASIAAFVHGAILITVLNQTLGGLPSSQLLVPPVKIIIASALTGFFLWLPMRLLDQFVFDTTRTFNLIILTLLVSFFGALVYFALSKLLRIEQLNSYTKLFHKLGNWQKVLRSSDEALETPQTSI